MELSHLSRPIIGTGHFRFNLQFCLKVYLYVRAILPATIKHYFYGKRKIHKATAAALSW